MYVALAAEYASHVATTDRAKNHCDARVYRQYKFWENASEEETIARGAGVDRSIFQYARRSHLESGARQIFRGIAKIYGIKYIQPELRSIPNRDRFRRQRCLILSGFSGGPRELLPARYLHPSR